MKYLAYLWKMGRSLFRLCVSKLFYQPRIDRKGNPVLLRPFFGELNRKLMEKGITTPWILTREECWELYTKTPYARSTTHQMTQKPADIVQFLHEFWSPQVKPDNSILELGSGPGANLYYLYKLGYNNLMGIEINRDAIDEMRKAFPDLTTRCEILTGSLEDMLPKLDTGSVDTIFTMAVAYCIHPASTFLFSEMARVARKYICTVELEVGNCSYIFPRNFRRVFQRLGCPQLKSVLITREAFPNVSRDYDGYVARLFCKGDINDSKTALI